MDKVRRWLGLFDQWFLCATGHCDGPTRQLTQIQRVDGGLINRHIAEGGGDAKDVDVRMGQGVAEGHGVVYTGVSIKNDFVRHG